MQRKILSSIVRYINDLERLEGVRIIDAPCIAEATYDENGTLNGYEITISATIERSEDS